MITLKEPLCFQLHIASKFMILSGRDTPDSGLHVSVPWSLSFMNLKKVVRQVMDLHLNLQAAQKGYENV
jgi:hypothetical protein